MSGHSEPFSTAVLAKATVSIAEKLDIYQHTCLKKFVSRIQPQWLEEVLNDAKDILLGWTNNAPCLPIAADLQPEKISAGEPHEITTHLCHQTICTLDRRSAKSLR